MGLVWTAPSGKVSSYLVELYEGTYRLGHTVVQPANGNPDTDSTPLRVPYIKNGHRYNVSITARSMVYLFTETVDSDTYTEQIKTVVIRKYGFLHKLITQSCLKPLLNELKSVFKS